MKNSSTEEMAWRFMPRAGSEFGFNWRLADEKWNVFHPYMWVSWKNREIPLWVKERRQSLQTTFLTYWGSNWPKDWISWPKRAFPEGSHYSKLAWKIRLFLLSSGYFLWTLNLDKSLLSFPPFRQLGTQLGTPFRPGTKGEIGRNCQHEIGSF